MLVCVNECESPADSSCVPMRARMHISPFLCVSMCVLTYLRILSLCMGSNLRTSLCCIESPSTLHSEDNTARTERAGWSVGSGRGRACKVHTPTHTRAHTHTHTHARAHTHTIHTHTHTYTHKLPRTHTDTDTHIHTHLHIHTLTHIIFRGISISTPFM